MYILENTMLKKTVMSLGVACAILTTTGCVSDNQGTTKSSTAKETKKVAVDGGVLYPVKNNSYTAYRVNTQPFTTQYGKKPTATEIAAWDIDVNPDMSNMPKYDMKNGKVVLNADGTKKIAQGSVEQGDELFEDKCAMCHGEFGSGGKGYPALSGGDINSLTYQLQNPADAEPNQEPPSRKIGSYWPYASTLFWYIQDAMPFPHPKSLSNSETYAITAYLLSVNEIEINGEEIDDDFVLSAKNFKEIKMPNADGFYPNVDTPKDPEQGVKNVTKFLTNPKNYGVGTRCMTNCVKGKVSVLKIKTSLDDGIKPPLSEVKDLPVVVDDRKEIPGRKDYEASCSVCHATDMMGAPKVGDKEVWANRVDGGMDKLYDNAINGLNGMPPRGGTDFSDEKMKTIINYMIDASK